ncbi:MAG: zinc-binding dehydrogenase [Saprospiraceae bacterium]|nr:zinc-binding dehydrogenase [Saprospiraceae bacterium]
MNYIAYDGKAGALSNYSLKEKELAPPKPDEVHIAVKAVGLNFADIFAIWGLYGATPEGTFTPGLEYAGEVVAVGRDTKHIKVGDRVMGVTRFGGYTSGINSDERYVIPMPDSWTFEQGAAYLVQVLTAYYGLVYLGNIQKDATVLIHSGGGGVGLLARQIASRYDAYTIGTVGRPDKVAFLKDQGYKEVIVRNASQFGQQLDLALAGRELNLVMECIGGKVFKAGFDRMAPQGRMVVYGSARYASVGNRPNYLRLFYQFLTRPKVDPQKLIEENKALLGFNLIWLYNQADLMHELLQEIHALKLDPPHVGHTFAFEHMDDAIRAFQSGKTLGKVVLVIS